jgi:hypothetical protein
MNLIVSYGNEGNKLFVFVFVLVFLKTHLGDLSVVLVAQAPVLVKGGSRLNRENSSPDFHVSLHLDSATIRTLLNAIFRCVFAEQFGIFVNLAVHFSVKSFNSLD